MRSEIRSFMSTFTTIIVDLVVFVAVKVVVAVFKVFISLLSSDVTISDDVFSRYSVLLSPVMQLLL